MRLLIPTLRFQLKKQSKSNIKKYVQEGKAQAQKRFADFFKKNL